MDVLFVNQTWLSVAAPFHTSWLLPDEIEKLNIKTFKMISHNTMWVMRSFVNVEPKLYLTRERLVAAVVEFLDWILPSGEVKSRERLACDWEIASKSIILPWLWRWHLLSLSKCSSSYTLLHWPGWSNYIKKPPLLLSNHFLECYNQWLNYPLFTYEGLWILKNTDNSHIIKGYKELVLSHSSLNAVILF